METLLGSIVEFVGLAAASGTLGNTTYEILKNTLKASSLGGALGKFFSSEKNTEAFIETLVVTPAVPQDQLLENIKRHFQNIEGGEYPEQFEETLTGWVKKNADNLAQAVQHFSGENKGFVIGSQTARGDVINVQGNYTRNGKTDA